ncbi:hypothetical protein AXG93_3884s1140 [Marchantia polymorpha subsp. ruderalis]|uniref:Uncharacterized protein n=1 Tax=Marchantia polymorpha subsp. ruderalis TaxID=1480154 RepID=A0A176W9A9_MARPO|nr:hypothetical protein AXG93_3884s1140 [Marchantia polymorpha subsp. ruderalis]
MATPRRLSVLRVYLGFVLGFVLRVNSRLGPYRSRLVHRSEKSTRDGGLPGGDLLGPVVPAKLRGARAGVRAARTRERGRWRLLFSRYREAIMGWGRPTEVGKVEVVEDATSDAAESTVQCAAGGGRGACSGRRTAETVGESFGRTTADAESGRYSGRRPPVSESVAAAPPPDVESNVELIRNESASTPSRHVVVRPAFVRNVLRECAVRLKLACRPSARRWDDSANGPVTVTVFANREAPIPNTGEEIRDGIATAIRRPEKGVLPSLPSQERFP